jgi:hypothetical protein
LQAAKEKPKISNRKEVCLFSAKAGGEEDNPKENVLAANFNFG